MCVESLQSAQISERAGADRIELNSAIGLGGLTPSVELCKMIKRSIDLPVICMIRPRAGDFYYSASEFELMEVDAQALLSAGADGLAVGFLDSRGGIDIDRTRRFRKICGEKELVYHRAFDCTSHLDLAIKTLLEMGVNRVLTSGGQATASSGQEIIAKLNAKYGEQIEILPGAGINASNAASLVRATGCSQLHGTFSSTVSTGSRFIPELNFNEVLGLEANHKQETDARVIQEVIASLSAR